MPTASPIRRTAISGPRGLVMWAEFRDLACQAADHNGVDFVGFPVCDDGRRYSQILVAPLAEPPPSLEVRR